MSDCGSKRTSPWRDAMSARHVVTHRTAEESKAHNIEMMGEALGTQYAALWREVAMIAST